MCHKVAVVLCLCLGLVWSLPLQQQQQQQQQLVRQRRQQQQEVTIIKYEVVPVAADGSYFFSYELSDGSARSEKGVLMNPGTEDEYLLVTGSYRHPTPEGVGVSAEYKADKDGYDADVDLLGSGLGGGLQASLVG